MTDDETIVVKELFLKYDEYYRLLYKEFLWNSKKYKKDLKFNIRLRKERIREWQEAIKCGVAPAVDANIALRTLEIELNCLMEELEPKDETDVMMEDIKK